MTYGCIRFFDIYRFLSSSLDAFFETLVDSKQKTLKNLKKEYDGNDDRVPFILKEIETLINEDNTTVYLKKNFPVEIEKLEEALRNYLSENDPKISKTEFPDKRKFLSKKLACPFEYFNSLGDYQEPVNNLKIEEVFTK